MGSELHKLPIDDTNQVILVGDFNLLDVCWSNGTVRGPIDASIKRCWTKRSTLIVYFLWCYIAYYWRSHEKARRQEQISGIYIISHKGQGNRDDKNNYQLITVFPILSKLLEKHICGQLCDSLESSIPKFHSIKTDLIHLVDQLPFDFDRNRALGFSLLIINRLLTS